MFTNFNNFLVSNDLLLRLIELCFSILAIFSAFFLYFNTRNKQKVNKVALSGEADFSLNNTTPETGENIKNVSWNANDIQKEFTTIKNLLITLQKDNKELTTIKNLLIMLQKDNKGFSDILEALKKISKSSQYMDKKDYGTVFGKADSSAVKSSK